MTKKYFRLPVIGILFDLARSLERKEYYKNLLPQLAKIGYNTLILHFTDDQGCAYKFSSLPEAASLHSYEKEEMINFIALAKKYNIEVIPEIEALGHTCYITNIPKYHHLYQSAEETSEGYFNSLCPAQNESLEIIEKLIQETAEIFPSPYLHLGLDEVSFGKKCVHCQNKFKGKKDWEIYGYWVNQLHQLTTKYGKRMMMWGDHLAKELKLLNYIPSDIVICNWDYSPKVNYWYQKGNVEQHIDTLTKKGFEVLLCAASFSYWEAVIPSKNRRENICTTAKIALDKFKKDNKIMGVVNCVWVPLEFHPKILPYITASVADIFLNGGKNSRNFNSNFVKEYFGIKEISIAKKLGNLFKDLHNGPYLLKIMHFALPTTNKLLLKRMFCTPIDKKTAFQTKLLLPKLKKILLQLETFKKEITRNYSNYQSFIESVKLIIFFGEQLLILSKLSSSLEEVVKNKKGKRIIQQRFQETKKMEKQWDKIWMKYRYSDDPRWHPILSKYKYADSITNIYDRLAQCRKYLEKLL